jgi:hypothetical protein
MKHLTLYKILSFLFIIILTVGYPLDSEARGRRGGYKSHHSKSYKSKKTSIFKKVYKTTKKVTKKVYKITKTPKSSKSYKATPTVKSNKQPKVTPQKKPKASRNKTTSIVTVKNPNYEKNLNRIQSHSEFLSTHAQSFIQGALSK